MQDILYGRQIVHRQFTLSIDLCNCRRRFDIQYSLAPTDFLACHEEQGQRKEGIASSEHCLTFALESYDYDKRYQGSPEIQYARQIFE